MVAREELILKTVRFGNFVVGPGNPPYIVAEVGSNHNGNMDLCRRLIDAAANVGAHAVKFQSWSEKSLIAKEDYDRNTEYSDKKKHFGSLREMVKAYQFTPEQHHEAYHHCKARGIAFCSSVFSPEEVDLLDKFDVPFIKIASMDIVNIPLLRYAARTQRPLVISTGMANLAEIERAVEIVHNEGNQEIALLHCVSIYPPDFDMIHLRNMETLQKAFDLPVGFSDHTLGVAIPLAAIALGACIIEKHFTLEKDMEGWDHSISADPLELKTIVEEGRNVFTALGSSVRTVGDAEIEKRKKFRRSLVAKRALGKGHALTKDDLDAKRPGTGISPHELPYVLGKKLAHSVQQDQVISWMDLQ